MRGRCLQTAGRTERKNDKRMNYRLSRIAAICGGKFSGCDSEVRSVVTDSRSLSCELGCRPMFVAMRGANHDSHDFIADMQSRGVRAFLVERGVEASSCTGECGFVQVDNAIEALQRLAAYHRAQFRGTVVGITGSNGKTVIKEWIAEELPEGMKYYRSPKSYNSQLGVPLSVLMLEGDEELAIFEAGISKPGEMERLARTHYPPRRGDLHFDRRRPSGEFHQSGTEMRREDDSRPQRFQNHLPQLLRAAGPYGRGAFRRSPSRRCRLISRSARIGHRQRRFAPQRPDRRGVLRCDALSRPFVRRGSFGGDASRSEGGHQRLDTYQRRL